MSQPTWPAGHDPYGQPYGYEQPPVYGYPPPYPIARPTNGLAIGAMVCGIVGLVSCGVVGIVGVILGHISLKQIRESGDEGRGLAMAGLICGYISVGLLVLIILFYVGLFALIASTSPESL